jgi:hypothetical protein
VRHGQGQAVAKPVGRAVHDHGEEQGDDEAGGAAEELAGDGEQARQRRQKQAGFQRILCAHWCLLRSVCRH